MVYSYQILYPLHTRNDKKFQLVHIGIEDIKRKISRPEVI